ncbi:MAG TPA: OmpA family protein [Magnetospirillum sp.]|nr:OmpA family protein [Magnetospirillum sp.]
MRIKPFAALLLAIPALPGFARADDVLMLDHTPSVDELRSYLTPERPRRTRGIEIVGQAAPQPAMAATPAAAISQPAPEVKSAEPAAAAPTTIGYRVPFAYNSAELLPEGRPFLDQLGQVMQSEPALALAVEGHTDAHGGDAYNMTLSQRRAKAVQGYLSSVWHIAPARLTVIGKGKTEPLSADPFAAENRRVQFRPVG